MSLEKVSKAQARKRALELKQLWEEIVTDAIAMGLLTDDNCAGCGKYQCGGCPCGTGTGWRPGLTAPDTRI